MGTRECIDITHYAKSPRGSRRELASHARYPLLLSRSAAAFSNPTTIRYVAVAANAPAGQPRASGAWVPTRYAAATASPTEMKWKLPHRWIRLGGSPKCSLAPPKARAPTSAKARIAPPQNNNTSNGFGGPYAWVSSILVGPMVSV